MFHEQKLNTERKIERERESLIQKWGGKKREIIKLDFEINVVHACRIDVYNMILLRSEFQLHRIKNYYSVIVDIYVGLANLIFRILP